VGQRALEIAQDDPHEHVLLPRPQAEPPPRRVRQGAVRRFGQHLDALDARGFVAERLAGPIAEGLDVLALADGDRQIAHDGRHARGRAVGLEIEHLAGDARIARAQQPDVGHALAEHQNAVEAEAHREPRGLGPQPLGAEHLRRGEAALADLDPGVAVAHVDLAPRLGVRVRGGRRAQGPPGQERPDRGGDHGVEIVGREPGAAAAQAPQIELVGFARVQPIDAVAPVHDAGAGEHHVAPVWLARERGERGGYDGGRLGAEHDVAGDVARVEGVAGDAFGRVAQPIVVVGDRGERGGAPHARLGAPGRAQGGGRLVDEQLQGVGAVVGVGQVGDGKRAA
jgi:hypothetical protein